LSKIYCWDSRRASILLSKLDFSSVGGNGKGGYGSKLENKNFGQGG